MTSNSWVGLANSALIKLGVAPILNFTDDSQVAELTNARYVPVRQLVLRLHDWNCAKKQQQLAALASTQPTKWNYTFNLPNDFLRLIDIFDTAGNTISPYEIYGNVQVVAMQTPVVVEYVGDVTDATRIDPVCFEVMAHYLAYDIAFSIYKSDARSEKLYKAYELALQKAKTINGRENSNLTLTAEDFVSSRLNFPTALQAPNPQD